MSVENLPLHGEQPFRPPAAPIDVDKSFGLTLPLPRNAGEGALSAGQHGRRRGGPHVKVCIQIEVIIEVVPE